jgi:predicted ATPase
MIVTTGGRGALSASEPAWIAKLLLLAAPALRILATSREPLRVAGETVCPLQSLSVPDAGASPGPGTLQRFDSVRLFAARATASKPTFELNAQNAAAVATICQRLDGIPLALELAAARVRTLSLDAIAQRLNDRFHLLTSGDQTALPRQQTLRACIDWSYELLGAPERELLARLSVFAGGFTLDAAEAVGAHGVIEVSAVLDLLSRLVDKSLVAMEADGERYRLLETVRQYAQERLAASGDVEDMRTRHLAYYLALGEAADPKMLGDEQEIWHARLDADRENLLAAIGNAATLPGAAQAGLRLVHSVRMWLRRLSMDLASRFVTEALARDGAQERNLARADALGTAASFCYFQGRYDNARRLAEEGLAIAREQGDPLRTADGLALAGLAAMGQGDAGAARLALDEAVALSRSIGDRNRLQQSLNCLAEAHAAAGDLDAAEPMYEEALTLARDMGGRDTIAVALLNLGRVHLDRHSGDSAARVLREVLELVDEHTGPQETQQLLTVAAGLAAHEGDWARAARIYGAAQAQLKQHGLRREPADEVSLAPLIARARQATDDAGFAAREEEGQKLAPEDALRDVRAWLRSGG